MDNIVTKKTAIELRDAGFPQPAPEPGQWWYDEFEEIVCYGHTVDSWGEPDEDVSIFAPTATDILREMARKLKGIAIVRVDISSHNGGESDDTPQFSVSVFPGIDWVYFSDNPSEAAALAYLNLKK